MADIKGVEIGQVNHPMYGDKYKGPKPGEYLIAGKPAIKVYAEGQNFSVSVPLVELLSQYTPEGFLGDFLFPVVPVGAQAGAVPLFGARDARIENVDRAPGVEGNLIQFNVGTAGAYCRSRSLRLPIPVEMEFATDPAWKIRESGALYLQGALLLAKEARVNSLVADASNVSTTFVTTSAWNSTGRPLAALSTMISHVASASGLRPDRIAFGCEAWQAFAANSSVVQACGGGVTIKKVCEVLRVSSVAIGEARHNIGVGEGRLFAPVFAPDQVVVFRGGDAGTYSPKWACSPNWKPSGFTTEGRFIVELNQLSRRLHSTVLETHCWEAECVADPQLAALLKGVNSAQSNGI